MSPSSRSPCIYWKNSLTHSETWDNLRCSHFARWSGVCGPMPCSPLSPSSASIASSTTPRPNPSASHQPRSPPRPPPSHPLRHHQQPPPLDQTKHHPIALTTLIALTFPVTLTTFTPTTLTPLSHRPPPSHLLRPHRIRHFEFVTHHRELITRSQVVWITTRKSLKFDILFLLIFILFLPSLYSSLILNRCNSTFVEENLVPELYRFGERE